MKPLFEKHLLRQPAEGLFGKDFIFEGTLAAGDGASFFELGKDEKLKIADPRIEQRLLENVPPRVGGKYLYYDRARIYGVLGFEGGQIAIERIETGVLICEDGKEYSF